MDEEDDVIGIPSSIMPISRSPSPRLSTPSVSVIENRSMSRLNKFVTSFVIFFCTFTYGIGLNFVAPLVLEFSRKFKTDISHVSLVFTVITSAYLVGALITGILFNFINRQVLIIFILSCFPTALFLIPEAQDITYFFILAGFLGYASGGCDTILTAWLVDIWRDEAPPFILTVNFCYSLGTILPPLILAPYLKGIKNDPQVTTLTSNTNNDDFISKEAYSNSTIPNANLSVPFSIAGGLVSLAVLAQIVLFFFTFDFKRLFRIRTRTQRSTFTSVTGDGGDLERLLDEDNNEPGLSSHQHQHQRGNQIQDENHNDGDGPILTPLQQSATEKGRRFLLTFLSCCCVASYCGLELTSMQFLPTFGVYSQAPNFTEAQGAQLLFSCSLAYCICRGIGILLVLKIPPHFILLGNIILLTISNAVLLLFANNSENMLWFGSVLIGCGMSTSYPAYFAFIEKYIFVSNGFSTIVTVSAGLVSAIYPLIVGASVEKNPSIMIYVNFVSISVLAVSFSITFWVTWLKSWREGNNSEDNKRD